MPDALILTDLTEPLNAADLLRLGYVDDPLLLENLSLCTLCSHTCTQTAAEN